MSYRRHTPFASGAFDSGMDVLADGMDIDLAIVPVNLSYLTIRQSRELDNQGISAIKGEELVAVC